MSAMMQSDWLQKMNWIEEMEQLLVRETSGVYEDHVGICSTLEAFARLTNDFDTIGQAMGTDGCSRQQY